MLTSLQPASFESHHLRTGNPKSIHFLREPLYFGAWLDDPALAGSPAARGTNRWGGIYGHNWFFDPSQELSVVSMSNTGLEGCDGPFKDQVRDAVYAGL